MLEKKYRLTKKSDFDTVFKKGRIYNHPLFYIKFIANNLDYPRFAFIVGVKLFKKAVERNRVKRLMREAARLNISKVNKGADIIIGAKSAELYNMSCEEVEKELRVLLEKSGLIKQNGG